MPTCLRPGRKEEEKKKKKEPARRRWRSRALEGETEAFHRAGKDRGAERRGEDKPGRNRRSCRRIVARTALQCHLLSAPDDSPRSPVPPPGPDLPFSDSPASYEWAIAMQSPRPSLGIYPRLLLFGRTPQLRCPLGVLADARGCGVRDRRNR